MARTGCSNGGLGGTAACGGVWPEMGSPRFGLCWLASLLLGFYALGVNHPVLSVSVDAGPGATVLGSDLPGSEITLMLPGDVPLTLVRISAGTFRMGSPSEEPGHYSDEESLHPVGIGYDFYMGMTEVTQAQWLAVMGSWPQTAPDSGSATVIRPIASRGTTLRAGG